MNLSKRCKITRVSNAAVAAQTAITSSEIDMQHFDGCMFIALLGDVTDTCVLTLTARQDSATGMASAAALSGASATFTAGASDADNKVLMVDVFQPRERFLDAYLTRATANAVVDGIIAIQYAADAKPTTQDAGVIASAFAAAPAEA